MERNKRNLIISRISMGCVRTQLSHEVVYLGLPTQFHIYVGNEIYEEILNESIAEGVMTDEQILGILAKEGLWSYETDESIDRLRSELDDLKVNTFESRFRLQDYQLYKLRIKKKKQALTDLLMKKHAFDYASAEGLASLYRLNYLVTSGIRDKIFRPLDVSLDKLSGDDFNRLKESYLSARLDEATIRLLARTEPWRSYWAVSNKSNVFDRPLMEWTEEQQSLVIWSRLYDSIREHTEPPTEDVVNDDDAFDGWLILQGRKNKQEIAKKSADVGFTKNNKIKNAQEVFVMVGTDKNPMTGENIQLAQDLDDARRLDAVMNDDRARAIKRERFATIAAVGEMKVQQFGDIKRDLQMKANEAYRSRMKGG